MIHWQQYSDIERMQLLNIASADKKLPRLAINCTNNHIITL